jgi:hypothetical protein
MMLLGNAAYQFVTLAVIIGTAVGEVQPDNIDAGNNQLLQSGWVIRRWPEGGNNFGAA